MAFNLNPLDDRPDAPLIYVGVADVPPGSYQLRFGAVDIEGRRGTILRPLNAYQTAGLEFAVGDLIVAAPARLRSSASRRRSRLLLRS